MSNEEDRLADFDLAAWEVPPPPAELADAVIDRMAGTAVNISVPVEHAPQPRRAWLVAGVAVAIGVLAIGAWSLVRGTQPAPPSTGALVAERAQTLSLGAVRANLDPGADVRWHRERGALHVDQRAGTVAWHVEGSERLVISAGAGLASVEATDANVRVEVQMNAMDARVIGASAVTAAAVAMVTVVVYEGHVNVGRGGNPTVVVAPGATHRITNNEAPVVGGTVASEPGQRVAILGLELIDASSAPDEGAPIVADVLGVVMRDVAKHEGPYRLGPNADRSLVDEKLLNNCADEAPACMAAIGANLGVDVLLYGKVEPQRDGYQVSLKLLDIAAKTIARTGSWNIPKVEAQGTGFDVWGKKMYLALVGATATTCDAEALKDQGMRQINLGQHAEALEQLELSLACKDDPYVRQLAFMEACASHDPKKAKLYYKQLTSPQQQKLAPICISTKVAYLDEQDDTADENCDEVSCVLTDYTGSCCHKYKRTATTPAKLGRAAIAMAIGKLKPRIMACGDNAAATGTLVAQVEVRPNGKVASVEIRESPDRALSTCVKPILAGATFPVTQNGGDFRYPFVFEPRTPESCNADVLKEEGMQHINLGEHAVALAKFEASLKCKPNPYVVQLAFVEACSSGNSAKAKLYYRQLKPEQQQKFAQICIRQNVEYQ